MEQTEAYQFDEDEIEVLANALAMYASYYQHEVLPYLLGDESDMETLTTRASVSQRLAYHFIKEHEGDSFDLLSHTFQQYHDRPMDLSDYSEYDWYEHDAH
jgi:hypothetical protein